MAAKKCWYCGKPIGYERLFYVKEGPTGEPEEGKQVLVHANCEGDACK